jgi:FkbM family methyltransferase
MMDFGAYIGLTTLYAATHGVSVDAFEPSATNYRYLAANIAANPKLAQRIRLHPYGLGAGDERVPLFAKAHADSGSSIFQRVERQGPVEGRSEATADIRAAADVLRGAGLNDRTLLKIDIEGAEYAVLPAIATLLAEHKPWLHVSFHPFNLAADMDAYGAAVTRLRAGLQAAEATACYRYMHLFDNGTWFTVSPESRMDILRHYLLKPKPVARIASAQYGFVDAVAFSDRPLPSEA